ncbi:MAG TPA: ribose 5-phosphate isomerase A, partial [Bauldia sp.]|nr:ribose 5-phosphate isomerase A [Bauldia sp.]
MKLGLGTGRTAEAFVRLLGERVRSGLEIVGVPTSERTARLAEAEGIPLTTLDLDPVLDLTVDGADEIGPGLALIKGGGGALLREKIVAAASRRMLVAADESKLVDVIGEFPLPIEVVPFGLAATKIAIEETANGLGLSGLISLRLDGDRPFVT